MTPSWTAVTPTFPLATPPVPLPVSPPMTVQRLTVVSEGHATSSRLCQVVSTTLTLCSQFHEMDIIHFLTSSSPPLFSLPPGSPVPFRLSGGAIAGIVIACLAAAFVIIMGIIYGPDRWKKRHQYSWYNKLTTPSEWCDGVSCPELPRVRSVSRRTQPTPPAQTQVSSDQH